MKAKPIRTMNGLGCDCQNMNGLGDYTDYDYITLGGKQYSASDILDTQLIAAGDVHLYQNGDFTRPFKTVHSGDVVGQVYSYLKSTGPSGVAALEFYDGPDYTGNVYYALDDSAFNTTELANQGVETIDQQAADAKDAADKAADPVGYYLKKYGLPVLLIGGGIYLAATYGKAFIMGEISKPKSLSGNDEEKFVWTKKRKKDAQDQLLVIANSYEIKRRKKLVGIKYLQSGYAKWIGQAHDYTTAKIE